MSRVGYPGPAQTTAAPLVASGDSELRALARAIGVNQQSFEFHPDQVRSVETYTLQHLMEGRPQYIGQTIASAMSSTNAGVLAIAPMQRAEGVEFRHVYYEFVAELAVETPAQAPPNYLEVQESETRATLTRHALAVTATVQELRTSKGQFFFMGKLIYLTIAFIEQAELKFFQALIETPSAYARYSAARNQWEMDLARAGRVKDEYWDILRRHDNGFFALRDLIVQDFNSRNLLVTHVMMQEGVRSVVANSPLNTEYYRNGPGAKQNRELLGDSIGQTLGGLEIIAVRAYEYEKKDLHIQPLQRQAIIGAHFRMDDFYPSCTIDRYCSLFMAIDLYNPGADAWERFGPEDAIAACGRFGPDGRLHSHHDELINNWDAYTGANQRTVPIVNDRYDQFLYISTNASGQRVINKTAVWGHMEEWALPARGIERVSSGIAHFVRKMLVDSEIEAIRRGLADIAELYELPISSEAELAALAAAAAGERGRFGAPKLPAAAPAGIPNGGYKPPGYGTVPGYLELSNSGGSAYLDQELVKRAVAFRDAATKLHMTMSTLFDQKTHPALNPLFAPAGLSVNSTSKNSTTINSMLNFLQNVLDQNKATLLFNGLERATVALTGDYARLNPILREFPDRKLIEALGTDANAAAFERKFDASRFGQKYLKYSEAGQQVVGDAAPPVGSGFLRFFNKELAPLDAEKRAGLLLQVVRFVTSNTAPREITAASLAALATDYVGDLAQANSATRREADGGFSGLAISIDAIKASPDTVRAAIALQSPFQPGRGLNIGDDQLSDAQLAQLDATGANDNLTRLTMFSSAQPIVPGVRGDSFYADEGAAGQFRGERVPGFAAAQFTEIVGAELVASKNLVDRYRRAGGLADWVTRVSQKMLLLAPVMRQTLDSFVAHNVPLPLSFLIEQFNRRYTTSSMVFISHNPAAPVANTYYLDPDMHVGRDPIRKTIMYHMSMYLGCVINDPRRFFVAHDTLIVGYGGGENSVPFDPETFHPRQLGMLGRDGPSLLVFTQPYGALVGGRGDIRVPTTHDIRGYSDRVGAIRQSLPEQERPHHLSALYYTTKYDLEAIRRPTMADWYRFTRAPGVYNTTTHQGAQRIINPATGNFEKFIESQDPFKSAVGTGSRKLRESAFPEHYPKNEYMAQNAIALY